MFSYKITAIRFALKQTLSFFMWILYIPARIVERRMRPVFNMS